ncbi:helix-turn-helix domain-containing protein [Gordonia shandongensis]|uniref:helix-turn-helix domain-containing protein n=1 Tax=Gordonia shandongensis TaxID=376351 RepID=UPI0004007F36|nr:helix-turn-helix transcriptional regulator [Gordonia shandongensis]
MSPIERGSLDWDTYAFAFGHRLQTVRKARGLSQEELAHRCGLHRNAVSNLERATGNSAPHVADPRLSTVYRLAKALDVPPTYLLPAAEETLPLRAPEQETATSVSEIEAELRRRLSADDQTPDH